MFPFVPRHKLSARGARLLAVRGVVALLVVGFGCQVVVCVGGLRAWHDAVAPFEAVGARVVATGGDDFGRLAGRAGVGRIVFPDTVGDAEIAALAGRMRRFPNLDSVTLQGPNVTDAALGHLKGLTPLQTLTLLDTRVTPLGISALQRSLPNLTVSARSSLPAARGNP